jgi:MerR family transcriptional regulator/heat shock protein HspR
MALVEDLYFISMAARELGLHPQTLRKYERLGLIQPGRTIGSVRVYNREQLERVRLIKHLVDELGINLAGVQRLLEVAEAVRRLQVLAHENAADRAETRRRLAQELKQLSEIVGL